MRYLVLSMLTLSLSTLSAGQSVSKPEEPVKTPANTRQKQTVTPDTRNSAKATTSTAVQDGQTTPDRKMVMPDEVDQHDTTDIFAIPFDTSEAEEDIEIQNLDRLSDKLEAEKAERLKNQAAEQNQSKAIDSSTNSKSE